MFVPRSVLRYRGPTGWRKVALTFDDGPHPEFTSRILETLKTYGHTATFFVIGQRVGACPELLRAMGRQGCEVGNHCYSHPSLKGLKVADIAREVEKTDAIIRAVTGAAPAHFRPPYGKVSLKLLWYLFRQHRLPVTLWSVSSSHEYRKSALEILKDFRQRPIEPGDILLLHDAHRATAQALPGLLDYLAERKLQSVTLTELWHPGQAPPVPSALPEENREVCPTLR
jgi:peptidoglycan/xylan/chitin deacetylase (PgdA/CDA1 family)